MPNKANTPPDDQQHDQRWAHERHLRQSGHDRGQAGQQEAEDPSRRQQGGWQSDEELRHELRREVGSRRDRDYNPDGERPIDRR